MTESSVPTLAETLRDCRSGESDPPTQLQTQQTLQERLGYVPTDALGEIARTLGVTEADVAGTLSYYPDLRTQPGGRHLIRVCMGESCLANHGARVLCALRERLHVEVGGTTPDSRFTLEKVYCVGNCAVSPSVLIDGDLYGRVTPAEVATIIEKYQ